MNGCRSTAARLALAAAPLLAAGALAPGCVEDPPGACASDEDCAALIARGAIGDEATRCHPLDRLCYPGCASDEDCQGPAFRPGMRCTAEGHCMPGVDAGADGDGGARCEAGGCPACQACGAGGVCEPLPAGAAPAGDCPGDPACGGGSCDGAGACAYQAQGFVCAESCSGGQHLRETCDASHACVAALDEACAPYRCDEAQLRCRGGCRHHDHCAPQSLCDRSEAHGDGLGACVAPQAIVWVDPAGSHPTIAAALTAVIDGGDKTHVAVPVGEHVETIALTSPGTAILVGMGSAPEQVTIRPASSGAAVVDVAGGATMTIQGVTLTDGKDGLRCRSVSSRATLVEAAVVGNDEQGVDSFECDVVVRRSTIASNSGGGLELSSGDLTVVNTAVLRNGTSGASDLGGALLVPGGGTVVFANNTVAENAANNARVGGVAGGIVCVGVAQQLVNNIVWSNHGLGHVTGCTFDHSDVEGGVAGVNGNVLVDPDFVDPTALPPTAAAFAPRAAACLDGGADVSAITAIDLDGAARHQGAATDLGALEVQ